MFFPCYFANEIIMSSDKLSLNMFKSNWTEFTKDQKSIMIIFIERAKQYTSILIGGLFILRNETFKSVISVLINYKEFNFF